jgi:GntR family transcriptional regulator/MocR family aminotransferase
VDGHGARVETLTRGTGAAIVTPSHQYPTGVPLHPQRRHLLRAWARSTGGLVVEDDYDGEFRYDRQPVGALQGTAPGHVVYCGTASKTLGPALRLAWMALPSDLVGPVVAAKEEVDLHTESLGQLVLADLIATGAYDRHIRAARLRYRRRRELLFEQLAAFPALTAHGVPAGLHTLVTFPAEGPSEDRLLAECARRDIALRGLTELYHRPTTATPGLLVGFAATTQHGYPLALGALLSVLADIAC